MFNLQDCPKCFKKMLFHEFEQHTQVCDQTKKKCQFCKNDVLAVNFKSHLQNECSKRNDYYCNDCQKSYPKFENHVEKCEKSTKTKSKCFCKECHNPMNTISACLNSKIRKDIQNFVYDFGKLKVLMETVNINI